MRTPLTLFVAALAASLATTAGASPPRTVDGAELDVNSCAIVDAASSTA